MRKFFYLFSLSVGLSFLPGFLQQLSAQGCSDAGFCSMGAMRPDQHFAEELNLKINSVRLEQYYGHTRPGVKILNTQVEVNLGISHALTFQVKMPYAYTSGKLGTTNGPGDISYSFTRHLFTSGDYHISATIGGKIPSNNSDLRDSEGRPLPMYQQTSLGTWDIVLGAAIQSEKWLFSTGLQHAFNENSNSFLWGPWQETEFDEHVTNYHAAIDLKRGTDVMFRLQRNERYRSFEAHLGLLSIARITKDEITDPETGERTLLDNSTGFAHNATFSLDYHISANASLSMLYALKLAQREVNPDGLLREYVATVSYTYKF